jgi:hypothetical protein
MARFDFLPSSQFNCLMVMLICFRFGNNFSKTKYTNMSMWVIGSYNL